MKKTVRGTRRELRGQSPALARQEAWGLLVIHNTAVARAAVQAGADPKLIPFAPALALIREHVAADSCCPHYGLRPASPNVQVSAVIDDIARLSRHRAGRQRTSPWTAAERRTATPRTSATRSLSKNQISQNKT